MDKELEAITSGTVGFFWPILETGEFSKEPERGFVSKASSRGFEIRTLNEEPSVAISFSPNRPRPSAIVSMSPEGSAVFLQISKHGGKANFGGRRASAYNYTSRMVISRFPVEELSKPKLDVRVRELRAHFPGISRWAGLKVSNIKHERKPDGRLKAAVLRLESPEEMVVDLGSLSLIIGGHWEVDNDEDRASVYSPVSIGVKAKRPRDATELLEVLLRVQDLVNVAYDTFMRVDGGVAVMGVEAEPARYPQFWHDGLMEGPANRPSSREKKGLPLFCLADLNGAQGISRWVRLYREFPSAFDAVAAPYRIGGMTWHGYLRETAVGMERLVAAARKKGRPAWTKEKTVSLCLARRVGHPFADFVADVEKWADLFWSVYNGGKHQASYDPDPKDIMTLAASGNLLLTAYLLHRCGMSKSALSGMFKSGVSYQLRDRVQELVQNPPVGLRPTSSR
ncbi:HEPN domain-containing protein [Streptomyces lavendofoliae]|uniref:ApeA N-terminal domain 1-containing protein n=1 Tax=Streptomyces lavendofoliae TaxID=67314 RepID=UPI00300ED7F2